MLLRYAANNGISMTAILLGCVWHYIDHFNSFDEYRSCRWFRGRGLSSSLAPCWSDEKMALSRIEFEVEGR
jgi:hypothetical protein